MDESSSAGRFSCDSCNARRSYESMKRWEPLLVAIAFVVIFVGTLLSLR